MMELAAHEACTLQARHFASHVPKHMRLSALPSVSIIGAGAIGGYYGTRFLKAGFEVVFFESNCAGALRAKGLTVIHGPDHETFSKLKIYDQIEALPKCDRVVICLKTTQNAVLKNHLSRLPRTGGAIVCMQNGFEVEQELAKFAPHTPLFGALCFVSVSKRDANTVEHLDHGQINLAEYKPDVQKSSGLLETLAKELRLLNVPVEVESDLEALRWKKLLWNIPFNGLSAVLNTTTDAVAKSVPGRTLANELMVEVSNIALARGKKLPESFREMLLAHTALMKPTQTSLGRDLRQGRALEIEAMFRRVVREAARLHIAVPTLAFLASQLEFLEFEAMNDCHQPCRQTAYSPNDVPPAA